MRINFLLASLLISISFFINSEEGIAFKENYEVSIELEGTDKKSIGEGMSLALKELTINISGNSEVIKEASIKKALRDPESLITQYKLTSEEELIKGIFTFDGKAIRKLLSSNKLPLWIGQKQKALLFLPCRNNVLSTLVDQNDINAFNDLCINSSNSLKEAALERNIILIEPSLDLSDLNSITFFKDYSDAGFLKNISSRYGLKYWSICKIQDEFGMLLDEAKCLTSVTEDQFFSTKEMVNILANETNKEVQILVNTEKLTSINLEFSGIEEFSDFLRLKELVSSNVLVKRSELISIEDNTLMFYLEITGGEEDLRKLMDSNPSLIRKKDKDLDSSSLIGYSLTNK